MPPTSWFLKLFLKSQQTLSCCYSFYLPKPCLMERIAFLYCGASLVLLKSQLRGSLERPTWRGSVGELQQAKEDYSVTLALFCSAWMPGNCTSLIHPLQGLFSPEKRRLRDKSLGCKCRRYWTKASVTTGNCGVKAFRLGWWEGCFCFCRVILEVNSDPEGCCGVLLSRRTNRWEKASPQGWFPCASQWEEKDGETFLGLFPTF